MASPGSGRTPDTLAARRRLHQPGSRAPSQTFREIVKVALYCAGKSVPARIERAAIAGFRPVLAQIPLVAVTPEKVDEFLATLPAHLAARTRNAYRTSVLSLFSFLVKKKRLPYNPMLTVTRHAGEKKRRRRALPPEQLQRLLDAAKTRPLDNTLLVTRGRRKGQRVPQPVEVSRNIVR